MRHYEILLMVHPDRSVIVSSLIEQYKNVILMNNGIIHRLEDWGKRSLAYPIKKLYKAHYVLFNIEVVCKTMFELEDLFRFNDYIIRNMIVRLKKAITDASPMMIKVKDESSNIVVSD